MVLTLVKSIGGANNFIRQTFFKKHEPEIRQREIRSILEKTYTIFVGKLQAISSWVDIIADGGPAVSRVDRILRRKPRQWRLEPEIGLTPGGEMFNIYSSAVQSADERRYPRWDIVHHNQYQVKS